VLFAGCFSCFMKLFETDFMLERSAIFSPCRTYRYELRRIWDLSLPLVQFIGLNPSYADEVETDNTLTRCIGFARAEKFGGLIMQNLFAAVTPYPTEMMKMAHPVGMETDRFLLKCAEEAKMTIAAWGNDGAFLGRDQAVKTMFAGRLYCLKTTSEGHPHHPLYLKKTLRPFFYC
jgi:hypothetical protein